LHCAVISVVARALNQNNSYSATGWLMPVVHAMSHLLLLLLLL
jgi:hypothetical protein